MTLIKGIPIILKKKKEIGKDGFNEPIYEYEEKVVENVLVLPTSTDDIVSAQDLYGKKAVYTLAIPKGDRHIWEDQIVHFFGHDWRTFGYPVEGIEANIPLLWNKKVMVERYG